MQVIIKNNDGGEIHFEGEPTEVINDVEKALKKLYPGTSKAQKWDELDDKISEFYPEDNDENAGDLGDIGEVAARAFGWL